MPGTGYLQEKGAMGPEGYGEYSEELGNYMGNLGGYMREKTTAVKKEGQDRGHPGQRILVGNETDQFIKSTNAAQIRENFRGYVRDANSGNEVARRGGTRGGLRGTWNSYYEHRFPEVQHIC